MSFPLNQGGFFHFILDNKNISDKIIDYFEASVPRESPTRVSPTLLSDTALHWYFARRFVASIAWQQYHASMIDVYNASRGERGLRNSATETKLLEGGGIPAEDIELLISEYSVAENSENRDERLPGMAINPFWDEAFYVSLDRQVTLKRTGRSVQDILSRFLVANKSKIEEFCGHNFYVVSYRAYSQLPDVAGSGGDERRKLWAGRKITGWHRDDYCASSFKKIMIYPAGAGIDLGTTVFYVDGERAFLEGEPGSWAIFDPNQILHAALPPIAGNSPRPTIEILIAAAPISDCTARNGSIVSTWPWLPPGNANAESAYDHDLLVMRAVVLAALNDTAILRVLCQNPIQVKPEFITPLDGANALNMNLNIDMQSQAPLKRHSLSR